MDLRNAELIRASIYEDRLREAEQARILAAVAISPGIAGIAAAHLGRLLVSAGTRLEAIAARSPRTSADLILVGDPCHGCAN